MSIGDYLDVILLGVDSLVAFAFYRAYKSIQHEAHLVETAPCYEIGKQLNDAINEAPNKCLPYVTIVGSVKALEHPVTGVQSSLSGVLTCSEMFEHRSIRSSAGWHDVSNKLTTFTDACRFSLVNPCFEAPEQLAAGCIEVTNVMDSDYLLDSLPVVYSSYEPFRGGTLTRCLDVITGNLIRGHHLTERILKEDATLLAVGRVCATTTPTSQVSIKTGFCLNPGLQIGPPLDSNCPFVLSLMNKNQVVESIRGRSQCYKVTCYIFSIIGVGLLGYIAYRLSKRWKLFGKDTSETGVNPSLSILAESGQPADSPCVICLTRFKELVLMPCRHMCVCSACYDNIITPKKCPICRADMNLEKFISHITTDNNLNDESKIQKMDEFIEDYEVNFIKDKIMSQHMVRNGTWVVEKPEESIKNKEVNTENKSKILHDDLMILWKKIEYARSEQEKKMMKLREYSEKIERMIHHVEVSCGDYQLLWKVRYFDQAAKDAKDGIKVSILSPVFDSHRNGYKMQLNLYPNGEGEARHTHVSMFITVMKGASDSFLPWPFECPITFALICQNQKQRQQHLQQQQLQQQLEHSQKQHNHSDEIVKTFESEHAKKANLTKTEIPSFASMPTSATFLSFPSAASIPLSSHSLNDHVFMFNPKSDQSYEEYFKKPVEEKNKSISEFISLNDLYGGGFVENDCICIKVLVDVSRI
ncbi:hypothetical protein HELRODRAFT_193596 [Helobdella robusta]|uniref:RING-type E3 ubiquitin transferase n=1 Tax=Helobdella robusta TaxID=6412 RepID=T1FV57_HELRO|nr:hypothetical protein HELRODRAFT_193596 [Helobdella robusta]ESN95239.1 hypothetical protein HELRODRAFT_193596 [Helobdella robusta]